MGTRSTVARRLPDGSWEGRYVHWDGYPSGVGGTVKALIERDGAEQVIKTVIEDHYGWSSLDHNNWGLSLGQQDGRFASVEGYGVAYTTETGGLPGGRPQSTPEDWVRSGDNPQDSWLEFAYVIEPDGSVTAYRESGNEWVEIPKEPSGEWIIDDGE